MSVHLRTRRAAIAIALTLALGGTLAACGGGGSGDDASGNDVTTTKATAPHVPARRAPHHLPERRRPNRGDAHRSASIRCRTWRGAPGSWSSVCRYGSPDRAW